jgi:hypothetical protein
VPGRLRPVGLCLAVLDIDLTPDATRVAYAIKGDAELFVLTGF